MRQFTAILLLAIFLFSNTAVNELGKIGAFIGHFMEHRDADPEISLLEFLQIHYFNGNVHDADYDRDMQLPFKSIDCVAPGVVFTMPSPVALTFLAPPVFVKNKVPLHNQSLFPNSHLSDIWQPPKCA